MGARGPAAKPTALRKAQGHPGHITKNLREARPKTEVPSCPNHLSGDAKREWRRIVGLLAVVGLVSQIDRATLAAYCQAYGRWCHAERMIKKEGAIITTPNGHEQKSPWLTIADKAMEQMHRYAVEFGLTPASRTRIHVIETSDKRPKSQRTRKSADRRAELLDKMDKPAERIQA